MNKLFIALALAASCAFAHAAPPADCAADISRQIQEDKDVAVNVRPNAKLCLTMNEPIVAVEYRNGDTPLRWQTNQDGVYSIALRAAEDAHPMRWKGDFEDGRTLVLQAPEDAYPVGVHVTTFTGKVYTFQVAQTNGLDY